MTIYQDEDALHKRKTQALADLGLTIEEVEDYVTDVETVLLPPGYRIFFSIDIPQSVRARVQGLGDGICVQVGADTMIPKDVLPPEPDPTLM